MLHPTSADHQAVLSTQQGTQHLSTQHSTSTRGTKQLPIRRNGILSPQQDSDGDLTTTTQQSLAHGSTREYQNTRHHSALSTQHSAPQQGDSAAQMLHSCCRLPCAMGPHVWMPTRQQRTHTSTMVQWFRGPLTWMTTVTTGPHQAWLGFTWRTALVCQVLHQWSSCLLPSESSC